MPFVQFRRGPGLPFIVAELLEGEDLGQRLTHTKKLELTITVPIVRQLCAGLSAAHAQGVVDRDLEPDDVLRVGGDNPTVKLLDFGIARVNDTAERGAYVAALLGKQRSLFVDPREETLDVRSQVQFTQALDLGGRLLSRRFRRACRRLASSSATACRGRWRHPPARRCPRCGTAACLCRCSPSPLELHSFTRIAHSVAVVILYKLHP